MSSKLEIGLNEGLDFPSRVERSDLLLVVVVVKDSLRLLAVSSKLEIQDVKLCLPSYRSS